MKPALSTRLEEWRQSANSTHELRTVNILKSKSAEGEFEIALRITSEFIIDVNRSKKIVGGKKFQTTGQTNDDPNADVQLFNDAVWELGQMYDRKWSELKS